MAWDVYRRVFARPGAGQVLGIGGLVRVVTTATMVVLTLRVVLPTDQGGLGLGYTQAGLLGALVTVGAALGSPVAGRAVDRVGARAVLLVTAACQALFWLAVAVAPFAALAPAALVCGVLSIPVMPVGRQALAVLVDGPDRQAALALDTMSLDVAYTVGPPLGVLVVTQAGPLAAVLALAVSVPASAVVLAWPVGRVLPGARGLPATGVLAATGAEGAASPGPTGAPAGGDGGRGSLRALLRPRVVAMLLVSMGSTAILSGTDVNVTASMRDFEALPVLAVVILLWTIGSLAGGIAYGAQRRRVPPVLLLLGLAVLTAPVALAGNWVWLAVLLLPAGLCCTPVMAAAADQLVEATPPGVRGTVLGMHASALALGSSLGAVVCGAVIDDVAPAAGYLAAGAVGATLAVLAALAAPPARLAAVLPWRRAAPSGAENTHATAG